MSKPNLNDAGKYLQLAQSAASLNVPDEAQQSPQVNLEKLFVDNVPDEDEPPALFNINGVEVLPEEAVTIIAAQKKNGKSNFAGLLMAASITPDHTVLNGAVRSNLGQLTILNVDTEQPLKDVRRTLKRVMKSAGFQYSEQWRAHKINVISVKDVPEDDRQRVIEEAINMCHPQLVFVDGIADLLASVNDEQASKAVMAWMDGCSNQYKCAIVGMLHLNYGSSKIGGWAGTMAAKKYTDYFGLKKSKNSGGYFTVEHEGRGESAPDLRFRIVCPPGDKIGWWENVDAATIEEMTKEDAEALALTEMMDAAPLPCNNAQLVAWVMKVKRYTTKSPADNLLRKCKKLNILASKRDGRTSTWYKCTDTTEQQELEID